VVDGELGARRVSDFDFIAWSLVTSGCATVLIFGIARIEASVKGKPPYWPTPVELALSIALMLFTGGVFMRFIADHFLHVHPPSWSELLIGGMFVIMGTSNVVRWKEVGGASPPKMDYVLIGLGVMILALELL
jgi:hypothetical protein